MKKTVIFGCSGMGENVYYSLDKREYNVVAFIDNVSGLTTDMAANPCAVTDYQNKLFLQGLIHEDVGVDRQVLDGGGVFPYLTPAR